MDYQPKDPNMTPEEAIRNVTLYIVELVNTETKNKNYDAQKTKKIVEKIISEHIETLIEFERHRIWEYLKNFSQNVFTLENRSRLDINDRTYDEAKSWIDFAAGYILHGEYLDHLEKWNIDPTPWYTALKKGETLEQL